jgi:uncharacterized protein YlxW (UPF0749 family)
MGPEVLGIFVPILAVIGFFGLMGLKTWSNHKLKMRETSGGDDERLTEAVQQLYDEVGSMREDLAELHERVDFTERMLSDVRSRNAIGPGDST